MRSVLAFGGLALLATPLPAGACSVAPGYRVPTNMKLVERAELILLGTVAHDNYEPGSGARPLITVVPVAVFLRTVAARGFGNALRLRVLVILLAIAGFGRFVGLGICLAAIVDHGRLLSG